MAQPDGSVAKPQGKAVLYVILGLGAALFCLGGPILGAIFLPAMLKARQEAQLSASLTNVKLLASAAIMYSADNNDRLPPAVAWRPLLAKIEPKIGVMTAPKAREFGYAFNKFVAGKALVSFPKETILFFDSDHAGDSPSDDPKNLPSPARYGDSNCVSYVDGTARAIRQVKAESP